MGRNDNVFRIYESAIVNRDLNFKRTTKFTVQGLKEVMDANKIHVAAANKDKSMIILFDQEHMYVIDCR